MQPLDLIDSAKKLVATNKGKPSQVSLRRATSSAYYGLFHCLARNCADTMIGGDGSERSKHAWRQIYRALEHGPAKTRCKEPLISKFPKAIEDFANQFVAMQEKRHNADYDPYIKLSKSEVLLDILAAEQSITDMKAVAIKDRRAFAAYVLFKQPRT